MKKIFSVFIAVFLLCCSCAVAASAAEPEWVVGNNIETLTHGSDTFVRLYNDDLIIQSEGSWHVATVAEGSNVGFNNEFQVCTYPKAEYIVELQWFDSRGDEHEDYFCLESHAEELGKLAKYQSESYCVSSANTNSYVELDLLKTQNWLQNGNKTVVSGDCVPGHTYGLYSSDKDGKVFFKTGMLIRDLNDSDKYYIIRYSDYDRSDFYRDGSFALEAGVQVTLYELNDTALGQFISTQLDYTGSDDLDWLVTTSESRGVIAVSSVFLFAIIPLVLLALSIVFITRKVRKPYSVCLWVLMSLSAITVISFAAVFTSLL